ncbi:MAG: hypothetical protein P1U74_11205 [Legionellaceae bacterium]|nr:hypothetical protein [Legionellaceae bacterium]
MCERVNEGQIASITCPTTLTSIDFASYGTPTGTCGSYAISACNAATSVAVVTANCLSNNSCTVSASNVVFGDPCGVLLSG